MYVIINYFTATNNIFITTASNQGYVWYRSSKAPCLIIKTDADVESIESLQHHPTYYRNFPTGSKHIYVVKWKEMNIFIMLIMYFYF